MSEITPSSTLIVTFNFPPESGGIETLLYQTTKRLNGEKVVLALDSKGARAFDQEQEFEIYRLACRFKNSILRSLFLLPTFFKLIKKYQIKNIHCANIYSALVPFLASFIAPVNYSVWAHGMEITILNSKLRSPIYKWICKSVLRKSSLIFANSNFTAKQVKALNIINLKIEVVKLGVDPSDYINISQSAISEFNDNLLKKYSMNQDLILFGLSRLVKRKGYDLLFEALKKVEKTYPRFKFFIGGTGPEEKSLSLLVKRLDLEQKVIFLGKVPQPEVPFYYNVADIFILNNRYLEESEDVEGFGIVFLEANLCGTPVIGGRSGGAPDAIEDGKTGFLVDSDNPEDIAEKIIKLMEAKELRLKMGLYGKERAIGQYSYENMAKHINNSLKLH
ncbi:MAG: glycosyltransferase family 4 protein [Halobacteriovoraceae bacterium]|nr:glycosyltransferase family 4 protein [Halobacteriovoraceae bacterium]